MTDDEQFTLIEEPHNSVQHRLFDDFQDLTSAKTADHDIQFLTSLRKQFPELIVTSIPSGNCNLLAFANSGNAIAELDKSSDSFASWRGWIPALATGEQGRIGQTIFFAKYHYQWNGDHFLLYAVGGIQYVLTEPRHDETALSVSRITDSLIATVGTWQSADTDIVWVFDNYWQRSKPLWEQVQKAEWEKVILDEDMKKNLTNVSKTFFENKQTYEDLGVPWKRGIIFYGPAGNGKTISIKALMHTLLRQSPPIATLYVKSAPSTYHIRGVFSFARRMSPCLLVFEDIDTIVTKNTRSYFFNECDGLENNDGILMVASTNHLDQLDAGLSKRPSRFDRKYLFPLPSEHERTLYADYWRHKLRSNQKIEFPPGLSPAIASITDGFSFAYMQEAFVASLLVIARDEPTPFNPVPGAFTATDNDDLGHLELWRVIKEQIAILREDMDQSTSDLPESVMTELSTSNPSARLRSFKAMKEDREPGSVVLGSGPRSVEDDPRQGLTQDLETLAMHKVTRGVRVPQSLLMQDIPAQGSVGNKRIFVNSAAFQARP